MSDDLARMLGDSRSAVRALGPTPRSGGTWRPSRAPFLSEAWIEGDLPGRPDREMAVAGQLQLRRGTAIAARLDLAMGNELRRFKDRWSFDELGQDAGDFATHRLGTSWSHLTELCTIARRLEDLPVLRSAFLAGALSRSKVRDLVRVATPESDRGWTGFALGRSVRELGQAIASFRRTGRSVTTRASAGALGDDAAPEAERVAFWATPEEAALFRGWGRAMLRDVVRRDGPDSVLVEALLAEMTTELGVIEPMPPEPTTRRRRDRLRPKDLARFERRRALFASPEAIELPSCEGVTDAWSHLAVLQRLQAARNALAYERSRVLLAFQGRALHRLLGLSEFQHVDYVLGLAPRDVARAADLHARLASLPHTAAAWREGALGEREAWQISSVATRATEDAWLEHAGVCAAKRMAEEIDWHLTLRTVLPRAQYLASTGGVPSAFPEPFTAFRLDWKAMFHVGRHAAPSMGRGARTAAQATSARDGSTDAADAPTDADLEPDAPWLRPADRLVCVSFSAPSHVATLFRAVVSSVRATLPEGATDGTAVVAMLQRFAATHGAAEADACRCEVPRKPGEVPQPVLHGEQCGYGHGRAIHERDGWRCANPLCSSREHLHLHHIVFRSHGGSDDACNLVVLCERCHRRIHSGWLRIEGIAPDGLTFSVGLRADGSARERWRGGRRVPCDADASSSPAAEPELALAAAPPGDEAR